MRFMKFVSISKHNIQIIDTGITGSNDRLIPIVWIHLSLKTIFVFKLNLSRYLQIFILCPLLWRISFGPINWYFIYSAIIDLFVRWCGSLRVHINYLLKTIKDTQITKFMGPTWGPPGSCRPQMGPMLAPWTLQSGYLTDIGIRVWLPQCQWRNSQSVAITKAKQNPKNAKYTHNVLGIQSYPYNTVQGWGLLKLR